MYQTTSPWPCNMLYFNAFNQFYIYTLKCCALGFCSICDRRNTIILWRIIIIVRMKWTLSCLSEYFKHDESYVGMSIKTVSSRQTHFSSSSVISSNVSMRKPFSTILFKMEPPLLCTPSHTCTHTHTHTHTHTQSSFSLSPSFHPSLSIFFPAALSSLNHNPRWYTIYFTLTHTLHHACLFPPECKSHEGKGRFLHPRNSIQQVEDTQ